MNYCRINLHLIIIRVVLGFRGSLRSLFYLKNLLKKFYDKMRQNCFLSCYIYEYSKGEDISLDITQVYNDNKNAVYRLALTYLHSQAEAEDVCHDVFMKMIENKISIFPGKEKSWLLTVTANECKNRLKFWKRHEMEELSGDIAGEEAYLPDILETVMSLSVKERTVIYLYYYEGYSTEEIAEILKISASAVRSRMERARKHLKSKLEGELS